VRLCGDNAFGRLGLLVGKLILLAVLVGILAALHSVLTGGQFVVAVFVAIVVFLAGAIWLWVWFARSARRPDSALGRMLVLGSDGSDADEPEPVAQRRQKWLGRTGVTVSPLRPAGSSVRVVAVNGPRIVVRPAEAQADTAAQNAG